MEERIRIGVAVIHLVTAISVVTVVECATGGAPGIVNNSLKDDCTLVEPTTNNYDELTRTTRKEVLMRNMFGMLTSLISKSIKISRFQENIGRSGLLCTSEALAEVSLQVRDIDWNFCYQPSSISGYVEVLFQASMTFKKPVIFETFIDETKKGFEMFCDATSKTGSVQYTFPKESYVSFLLSVNERPKVQTEFLKSQCSVNILGIKVDSVSNPDVKEMDNTVSGIGDRLWNSMKGDDITNMLTTGILEALVGMLQPNTKVMQGNDWICIGESLDEFKQFLKIKGDQWAYKKQNPFQFISSFQRGIEKAITDFESQKTVKSDDTFMVTLSDNVSGKIESFHVYSYSPLTFLELRSLFGVKEDYYLKFFSQDTLLPLSNPGKSGAGLYISRDAKFIGKTLKSSEVTTVQNVLQRYLNYIKDSPYTLLPKFFGLYTYEPVSFRKKLLQSDLNMVVMNNMMPADLEIISQKYDLKGSRYGREASDDEKGKKCPTFKENDFLLQHSHGIYLKARDYDRLVNAVASDAEFLNDLNIVDYSLLLGISYEGRILSKEERERPTGEVTSIPCETKDNEETPSGGYNRPSSIPALTVHGERVRLYLGIIDVLQVYVFVKKLETAVKKSYIRDESFSVIEPNAYSPRFKDFVRLKVFQRMHPCPERDREGFSWESLQILLKKVYEKLLLLTQEIRSRFNM